MPIESLLDPVAIAAARLAGFALRRLLRRGGSAGPGLIADRISPSLLVRAISAPPRGLVVVSGSSGKSTTTKMLTAILRSHGLEVFTNSSTANMRQGVLTAIADSSDVRGRLRADIAVVELDEAVAAALAPSLRPTLVVLTNISEEQLDRFHSAERVAGMLSRIADRAQGLVIGHDDERLRQLAVASAPPMTSFGAGALSTTRLERVDGRDAWYNVDGSALQVRLPSRGEHYALDAGAAIEAARRILGTAFDARRASAAFDGLGPVFGRGEMVEIAGHAVELVLVQNPDSMIRNLALLDPAPSRLLLAVGDDVADASWLWRVPANHLLRVDVVSGTHAYDAAVRLAYEGIPIGDVIPDIKQAVTLLLALPAGPTTIVFTADSMRKLRRTFALDRAQA